MRRLQTPPTADPSESRRRTARFSLTTSLLKWLVENSLGAIKASFTVHQLERG